jgi:C4-dicarboxylate-specific signal transduction histidine kinase
MPEVWQPSWNSVKPIIDLVFSGEAVLIENIAVPTQRSGFIESGYFSFSHTPLEEQDQIVGSLCICTETTAAVRAATELEKLKSDLVHLSRVSAMETLAGSIAHELNQPLTAITGNTWLAERALEADRDDREAVLRHALAAIAQGASRASEIILKTRERIGRSGKKTTKVHPSKLVQAAASLMVGKAESLGAEMRFDLAADVEVDVDVVQIEQVLINLVQNSLDAVQTVTPKIVTIRTRQDLDAVFFSVEDTGEGIASPTEVFAPYFTTKTNGLGLGLSISRTIIKDHGGTISAEPAAEGACIRFSIPHSAS